MTAVTESRNDQGVPRPIADLVKLAQEGDTSVAAELRDLLDSQPVIWRHVGDLSRHAELNMLDLICGKHLLMKEATQRRLDELKAELADGPPDPLERLLIERISVCWLQVHHADLDVATSRLKDGGATSVSLYAQRRLDSAQRRYLHAVKQLALVRKLLAPGGKAPAATENDPVATQAINAPGTRTRGARSKALAISQENP
jgi:hypothetical protein